MINIARRQVIAGGVAIAGSQALGMPYVHAQERSIKIGLMYPLSGPQATLGASWATGAVIAVEQVNRAGGLLGRRVESILRDDKGTGVGAVAAARELHDLGVNLMVGGNQSPMALALLPLLPELNAVVAGDATAMSLTHDASSKYFFRINPNAHMFYGGLGQVIGTKYPDVAKWAFVVFDSASGRDAVTAFSGGLRKTSKAKLEFLDPAFVALTASDFKVEIGNVMSSGADGLYLGILGGPAVSFLQQARSVGLLRKLRAIGDGGTDVLLGKALQKNLPTQIWGRGYWYPGEPAFDTPLSAKLYEDYVAKTGDKYPQGLVQLGHKTALALLRGVEKAKSSETDAVIAAMEGLEFDSAEGKQVIRKEDHQALGDGHYANYMPSEKEPFYGVKEIVLLADAATAEPPTPGTAFSEG